MKSLLLICSVLLLIGLANLPIGYYTILRIAVTIGSIAVVLKEYEKGFSFRIIVFGLIAVLFNPIIPVYFHDKGVWMPFDLLVAILFIIRAFSYNKIEHP